jgi:hypothetical protein
MKQMAQLVDLSRQAQAQPVPGRKRQGIDLDRGTLGNWVGRACFHLMPIIHHMKAHLRGADRIFVDETRAPVLDPGRKATKSGYFWAVVSDDRGHGGVGPSIVLFHYAPGRGKEHPLKLLAGRPTDRTCSDEPGNLRSEDGRVYLACSDRWYEVLEVKPTGKRAMAVKDWINGQPAELAGSE